MANRFLTNNSGNLSNGTQNILGSYIGASNLQSGSTIKTNSLKQLVSTNLLISDIKGLSTSLGNKISNPSPVPLQASSFIKTGGTGIQYLMANGTVTTSSGSGGNSSNIYLYDNDLTTTPVPSSGTIRFNNAIQASATIIYVSSVTRDSIDIDEFLTLISDLNIVYIQDQNSSVNFIKYTVTADPTIILNSYISIPVSVITSGGTGATSFGAGLDNR